MNMDSLWRARVAFVVAALLCGRTDDASAVPLIGDQFRYNVNTNVGFMTSSSASGAVSEGAFTQAVPATTLNGGTVNQMLGDAFDGYNGLCIDVNNVGGQCNTASMAVYNQNGPSTLECSGRQVVFPPQVIGSLTVRRKVYVPTDASFARWLNIVTNNGAVPATVRLQTSNNLGSDAGTIVVTTSDGDATAGLADRWVTTFQNFSGTTSADPRLGHVLQGSGAGVGLAAIQFVNGDDNPFWRYVFSLGPGETGIIMNFITAQPSRAAAAAAAQNLSLLPPDAIACLTPAELGDVLNFPSGPPTPLAGCRNPFVGGKALLKYGDDADDAKDSLQWKWLKGSATSKADFGTPTTMTGYRLTAYDAGDNALFDAQIGPDGTCGSGKPCWKETATGFLYKDKAAAQEGIRQIKLKEGPDGKALIKIKAKGPLVDDPALPFAQPVTVQLSNTNGICWEATYSAPATKNEAGAFQDKAD